MEKVENLKTKNIFNTLIVGFVFIFFAWCVQYHWRRRRLYKMALQTKGPKPWPIVGNGFYFMGSNTDILNNAIYILKSYGSPVPVWLGNRLFFGISKPEHLEVIMNNPHALKKENLYKLAEPVVGLGLFTAAVPQWKRHRKIIMPTFNQKILDSFVEIFSEQATILTEQLEKEAGKGFFDVFDYFSKFTLDAICETAMGVTVNAQTTNSEFIKWANRCMEIVFNRMFTLWYHFDFVFKLTPQSKVLDQYAAKIRNFTGKVVQQKREAYQETLAANKERPEALHEEVFTKRKTFLQQLIELSEGGEHLSDEQLRDEVITVMIGGSETTASVNSFTLILLGLHPHIQEKVYQEVIDLLGKDRPVETTDLPHLQYTEMVIKESMRIFPIGPLLVRSITRDIKLDNCIIPSGSSVVFGIIHTHRDPKIWPEPMKFDPLRFLPEECAKRHPYSFLPFSGGPRNCVGLKYAMMAMKAVIATVVRKYEINTSYKSIEEIEVKADLVLKPIHGYGISIKKREY